MRTPAPGGLAPCPPWHPSASWPLQALRQVAVLLVGAAEAGEAQTRAARVVRAVVGRHDRRSLGAGLERPLRILRLPQVARRGHLLAAGIGVGARRPDLALRAVAVAPTGYAPEGGVVLGCVVVCFLGFGHSSGDWHQAFFS